MNQRKVQCILEWPIPKSIKELRGYLSLIGYYRCFIKGYGVIAKPLIELLKKEAYLWSDKVLEAFKALKIAMTIALVSTLPYFNKEFIVETDAFGLGVGVVLTQEGRPSFS